MDGSSFNWTVYFGKDNQRVCFNDAAKVKHGFGRTANGHLMVIMKIRPAREINEAVLNEQPQSMGLTLLCTLEPTRWDPDERMVATRSLDKGDKAAHRSDWAQLKQLRRVQVKNDMLTTEKRQKKRYKDDKSLVNALDWEGAFGEGALVGDRSVIIILPRAEKSYELEKTYETARVAVFANYRGGTPMHKPMRRMAEQMWNYWKASKGLSAEAHLDNVTKGTAFPRRV